MAGLLVKNNMRNNALQMASEEQRKADENVLRLVEEQQRAKEEAPKKVLELERNLNEKQKLEIELEELKGKLEVMKHMGGDDDAAIQQKMNQMNEQLQDKKDNLDGLEELNQQLLAKERQSNDELQDARKVLIAYVIKEDDDLLSGLKEEWGDGAVTTAMKDNLEYNASGGYICCFRAMELQRK
ncbi:hypothetical protein BUALT_Bualt07G0120000 [Buddleja alternifolia]|uniref:Factor of DNA methylation 1-5/IDN2 domain-containing protein n=1 Tax=Buddleja alternifolia TaxID=168488 RepID=A0AAV6XH31_9LAMI|nr:hypothetical protein BUALT_Bualt07G0120000 [Buddleja alternifolia]